MVTPNQKRIAVVMVQDRFGILQRLMLIRDGYVCNRKRIQCLWRAEGPYVGQRKHRKPKTRRNPVRIQASFPNHVWAIDFQFDETADGRPVKILNFTDEYTREALACAPSRTMTADDTMTVLDHVCDLRGISPQFLRIDNGPEFIADVMIDWCRQTRITTAFVDPGSPWQNGHIESFNGKLRDELLSREVFDSMRELKILLEDHRNTHNFYRPHSSLGYLTPHEYTNRWHQQNNRLFSKQVDQSKGSGN